MPRVDFTQDLLTGIKAVDADHHMLFDIGNALHDIIDSGAEPAHVASALGALIRYIDEHFGREERLMESAHYAGLVDHMKRHQQVVRAIHRVLHRYQAAPEAVDLPALQAYFNTWLCDHIREADMAFVPAVRHVADSGAATPPPPPGPPGPMAVTVRVPPDQVDMIFQCAVILADGGEPAGRLAAFANELSAEAARTLIAEQLLAGA